MPADRAWLLAHLLGVILWVGGSAGAWAAYLSARRSGARAEALGWLSRALRVSHAGFLLALSGGTGLAVHLRLWPLPDWLMWKLTILGVLAVPLECANAWIVHAWLPGDLRGEAAAGTLARFERWSRLSVPLALLAGLAAVALAVWRP